MIKPDPLLFAHACLKLGSAPARSAMVGDRYERDIRGAAHAGLYTVWVNVHGASLPEGCAPPDATVDTIAQVEAVLPLA
jgi:FMN phosphatase YigB (HAD superfamily)